jgi:hypothetical protein
MPSTAPAQWSGCNRGRAMSADQFGILLDYIKIAARADAALPDLALVELPNGQIAPFEGGYASEEEARRGYLHAPHRELVSVPAVVVEAVETAKMKRTRRPLVFRERDLSRAIAGHLKGGLSVHHTMIDRGGRIVIFTGSSEPTNIVPANEWDDAL